MKLPDYIDLEAWDGFIEMRKSMNKKAWTPRAEKMALNKLETLYNQGFDANEVLDQSTFMGWKGLFPPKGTEVVTVIETKSRIERITDRSWAE